MPPRRAPSASQLLRARGRLPKFKPQLRTLGEWCLASLNPIALDPEPEPEVKPQWARSFEVLDTIDLDPEPKS